MSKKVHNFNQSKGVGDMGEHAMKELLEKQCRYHVDVTDDEAYWEPDVDFICMRGDLNTDYIEVKTDTYTAQNGNIFIETWSNKDAGTRGWYYECEADYLWYYAVPHTVYVFDLVEMREYFGDDVTEAGEVKTVWNQKYESEGVVVPLESIPERLYTEQQVSKEQ